MFSLPLGVHFDGLSLAFQSNGPHYFEMSLYNDFDIKQYGNEKKKPK
jgi:hypothetical protein